MDVLQIIKRLPIKPFLSIVFSLCLLGCSHDGKGMTPLMLAAHDGRIAELRQLISDGADVNVKSSFGWTALMFASREGHKEAVVSLLEKGADPHIISDFINRGFMATAGGYASTTALAEANLKTSLTDC